jgi:1-acyl-sn-glycerol-3-phosphate acyltransferase
LPLFVFPEGCADEGWKATAISVGSRFPGYSGRSYRIVPMALSGVYELLPIHTHHYYPGELTLRVGEPIETAE